VSAFPELADSRARFPSANFPQFGFVSAEDFIFPGPVVCRIHFVLTEHRTRNNRSDQCYTLFDFFQIPVVVFRPAQLGNSRSVSSVVITPHRVQFSLFVCFENKCFWHRRVERFLTRPPDQTCRHTGSVAETFSRTVYGTSLGSLSAPVRGPSDSTTPSRWYVATMYPRPLQRRQCLNVS